MTIKYHGDKNRDYVFLQIRKKGEWEKPISIKQNSDWVEKLHREITPDVKVLSFCGNCPQFCANVEQLISILQDKNKMEIVWENTP